MEKTPRFDDECEKYNYYHSLCPQCLGSDFDEGKRPMTFSDPRKNPNKHTCKSCGWQGYQHQLLPLNLEGVKRV